MKKFGNSRKALRDKIKAEEGEKEIDFHALSNPMNFRQDKK